MENVEALIKNLRRLGFKKSVYCKSNLFVLDQHIFSKGRDHALAFQEITHFLFNAYNEEATNYYFKYVWPVSTSQQSIEYFKIARKWLFKFTKVNPTYFGDTVLNTLSDYRHPKVLKLLLILSEQVIKSWKKKGIQFPKTDIVLSASQKRKSPEDDLFQPTAQRRKTSVESHLPLAQTARQEDRVKLVSKHSKDNNQMKSHPAEFNSVKGTSDENHPPHTHTTESSSFQKDQVNLVSKQLEKDNQMKYPAYNPFEYKPVKEDIFKQETQHYSSFGQTVKNSPPSKDLVFNQSKYDNQLNHTLSTSPQFESAKREPFKEDVSRHETQQRYPKDDDHRSQTQHDKIPPSQRNQVNPIPQHGDNQMTYSVYTSSHLNDTKRELTANNLSRYTAQPRKENEENQPPQHVKREKSVPPQKDQVNDVSQQHNDINYMEYSSSTPSIPKIAKRKSIEEDLSHHTAQRRKTDNDHYTPITQDIKKEKTSPHRAHVSQQHKSKSVTKYSASTPFEFNNTVRSILQRKSAVIAECYILPPLPKEKGPSILEQVQELTRQQLEQEKRIKAAQDAENARIEAQKLQQMREMTPPPQQIMNEELENQAHKPQHANNTTNPSMQDDAHINSIKQQPMTTPPITDYTEKQTNNFADKDISAFQSPIRRPEQMCRGIDDDYFEELRFTYVASATFVDREQPPWKYRSPLSGIDDF